MEGKGKMVQVRLWRPEGDRAEEPEVLEWVAFHSPELHFYVDAPAAAAGGGPAPALASASSAPAAAAAAAAAAPPTVLLTDRVEVSVSRLEAKGLPNVEKGSMGVTNKNDVYVKLRLGGKELRTEIRDDAGASATYDYEGKDAQVGAGMTWTMTVGELLGTSSTLRVSVWDDNADRKDKEPDVEIGSAEVAVACAQPVKCGLRVSARCRPSCTPPA